MSTTATLTTDSVLAIFERLNTENIVYAVLRNAENFPHFGHDVDLIVADTDRNRCREIFIEIAKMQGWQALTECHHWAKSKHCQWHNIEIFRFFHAQQLAYLQIDLFHGYLVNGLPFMTETELLSDRQSDPRGFTRIHPGRENVFRMLQLHRLYTWDAEQTEKIMRYRTQVLSYAHDHESAFQAIISQHMGTAGLNALKALQHDHIQDYSQHITQFKRQFFWQFSLKNPVAALQNFAERIDDYVQGYWLDPCGQVLPFHGDSQVLTEVLDTLVAHNLLSCWTQKRCEQSGLSWPERKTLERGGMVLKRAHSSTRNVLDLSSNNHEKQTLIETVISRLNARHIMLYSANIEGCVP